MRWLYHLRPPSPPSEAPYAPASLATEGFVHCSFRDEVLDSARLHFPPGAELEVLLIDPRRLDARLEVAATPRGPMPHVHGPIPRVAITRTLSLTAFATRRSELPDDARNSSPWPPPRKRGEGT